MNLPIRGRDMGAQETNEAVGLSICPSRLVRLKLPTKDVFSRNLDDNWTAPLVTGRIASKTDSVDVLRAISPLTSGE